MDSKKTYYHKVTLTEEVTGLNPAEAIDYLVEAIEGLNVILMTKLLLENDADAFGSAFSDACRITGTTVRERGKN